MMEQYAYSETSGFIGGEPESLAQIYEDSNIAVWQRKLADQVKEAAENILNTSQSLQIVCTVNVDDCIKTLHQELGQSEDALVLAKDVQFLVDMYCCLFELERVALRITKLDRAMCPKFHVDQVPARLITTYVGRGTEWLDSHSVDRTKLGIASAGVPDDRSGLYQQSEDIKQLNAGDVALLKGEKWEGNENNGIVHRSPSVPNGQSRLVMTFDFN